MKFNTNEQSVKKEKRSKSQNWRDNFLSGELVVMDEFITAVNNFFSSPIQERKRVVDLVEDMYDVCAEFEPKFSEYRHKRAIKEGRGEVGTVNITPYFRRDTDVSFTGGGKDWGCYVKDPISTDQSIFMDLPLGFVVKKVSGISEEILCYVCFAVKETSLFNPDLMAYIYTNQIQGNKSPVSREILGSYDYVKFLLDMLESLGKRRCIQNLLVERSETNYWPKVKDKSPNHPIYDKRVLKLGYRDIDISESFDALPSRSNPRIKIIL